MAAVSAKLEDWTSSETIKDSPDAAIAEQKIGPGAGAVPAVVPKETGSSIIDIFAAAIGKEGD